jgi:hypothetical protein
MPPSAAILLSLYWKRMNRNGLDTNSVFDRGDLEATVRRDDLYEIIPCFIPSPLLPSA